MRIVFGLSLDGPSWPLPSQSEGNFWHLGPQGILQLLENHLGLSGYRSDNEYLRTEQFRQAILQYLEEHHSAFFLNSFTADQFATAADLLARRDELRLAGWDFQYQTDLPERLKVMAALEVLAQGKLAFGYADRFLQILPLLPERLPAISDIQLVEPLELLPAHFCRLFTTLQQLGIQISASPTMPPASDTDLGAFQAMLRGDEQKDKITARGDGSLVLVKGKRDTELAAFFGRFFRKNPDYRPLLLIPDKSRILDNSLIQEGLPSMGIQAASLARPVLQLLKLATVFLWEPIDPYKILEFVSLSLKPLETELARRIGQQIAQTPGMQGESWSNMLGQYFGSLPERQQYETGLDEGEIRFQYRFWFERNRYDANGSAPKAEAIELFAYLQQWARQQFEQRSSTPSLYTLSEQARQVKELLLELPEDQLSRLELERIVRTIYEAASIQLNKQEKGALPFIHTTTAVTDNIENALWWNCIQAEPDFFFSRWYQEELSYLKEQGIKPEGPTDQNQRLIWQRKQLALRTQQQLILVLPEIVEGKAVNPHPLMGDLEALFGDLSPLELDVNAGSESTLLSNFQQPERVAVPVYRLGQPAPFIQLEKGRPLTMDKNETFSSLETLFYYPYQWVFRYRLRLRQSSILSIVKDRTLLGNLSHRFFEELLKQEQLTQMTQEEVERFIDEQSEQLFQREGVVLLMYGREPMRISFLKKVKFAAWSLVMHLQQNKWEVEATESDLTGTFNGQELRGRADLILKRGKEYAIIDLKWRGSNYRKRIIRNEEDLQLILYSNLKKEENNWAHTAYFIIEKGEMIARNNQAFSEINAVSPDSDHCEVCERILDRMAKTYSWRQEQLLSGRIEVRCKDTQAILEEEYTEDLSEMLEMKDDDAPFDEYRTLINRIQ